MDPMVHFGAVAIIKEIAMEAANILEKDCRTNYVFMIIRIDYKLPLDFF